MAVRTLLLVVFFFLFAALVKAAEGSEGGVTFWRQTVTLTCPETGTWSEEPKGENETYVIETYTNSINMNCKHGPEKNETYLFFVKGKTCENCFEMDPVFLGSAVIVDVMVTTLLMVIIYRLAQKKSSNGFTSHNSTGPARSGHRGFIEDSHYQSLNPATRTDDTYAKMPPALNGRG